MPEQAPQHHDYTRVLGLQENIMDNSDPFGGKIPNNAKDYGAYTNYYEEKMCSALRSRKTGMLEGRFTITSTCEGRDEHGQPLRMSSQKKEHFGCGPVFACNHAMHQDLVHPEGIWFVPIARGDGMGYFLCTYCFKSHERKRLDYNEIKQKCSLCLMDEINRVMAIDPGLVHNLLEAS